MIGYINMFRRGQKPRFMISGELYLWECAGFFRKNARHLSAWNAACEQHEVVFEKIIINLARIKGGGWNSKYRHTRVATCGQRVRQLQVIIAKPELKNTYTLLWLRWRLMSHFRKKCLNKTKQLNQFLHTYISNHPSLILTVEWERRVTLAGAGHGLFPMYPTIVHAETTT